jgi:hypothetical protein
VQPGIVRTLSVVAVVTLVATLVVFALPVQPAAAHQVHNKELMARMGQTTPITINSTHPGLMIAAFQGTGMNPMGSPAGTFEGVSLVPSDGKPLGIFVPVGMVTSIYGFDNEGYWLLGAVTPASSTDTSTINADAVIKATP